MALPKFLQPCLASYDLIKLDTKQDKELIITQILNKGNHQALRWLGKTYSQEEIKKTIASPTPFSWVKAKKEIFEEVRKYQLGMIKK